jgi:predicted AAA+ superfamily ATPase
MQTVHELCRPRANVFFDTTRDDVLNLSDLVENKIDVDKFFNENFQTKGMELLLHTAFNRFKGKSGTGVIKLTQAMGGGKTHNMLALALLAKDKDWRKKVLGKEYDDIGEIRVVAFSGRESDAEYGIWGSVADQLGKKEAFSNYYSPLKAPGESAWIKLLQGQETLILFDELPPYLENAKSITVGNSDLCKVTITALSNLFSALGKEALANVCLVFSDLKAIYESGSEMLQSSFKELENEANRSAINIEPVALNSDEIYEILKKRLFESYPSNSSSSVIKIATGYKDALTRAKKTGLTNYTGEKVFLGIKDSYPFHPSIKDLYARFKENPNFQQTRGLIKLMRQIVRQFYENGSAEKKYLINVFDINLNDRNTLSHIKQIKSSLEAAISHDIAQEGKSVAEAIDLDTSPDKFTYAQNF